MLSINNKYILILLVVLVFTINSLFVIQVKRDASIDERDDEVMYAIKSSRNLKESETLFLKKLVNKFVGPASALLDEDDDIDVDPEIKNATYGIIEKPNINSHSYNYIINPGYEICGKNQGEDLLLIAFVPIAVYKFSDRNFIRQTWASFNLIKPMRLVFMIGVSENSTLNDEVKFESELYGDIVQEDFMDTYRNLTLKTIMGLKWVSTYCSKAKFTLKVDDDVVVNSANLLNYLNNLNETNSVSKNTFLCKVISKAPVNRNLTSKFYLSRREYYSDVFPTYCDGPAYMFTSDIASTFYLLSQNIKQFVFEDVYMGMLASKMNSVFTDIKMNYTRAYRFGKQKTNVTFETRFFVYTTNEDQYSYIWNHFLKIIRQNFGF
jgi:beta-1,3-galactosyltransferase 1